jgi:transposase InsO family protein
VSPRRWDFISENRAAFGVKRICRVLGVSRSGYYQHRATADARAERAFEERRTVSEIRQIHAEHQGAYGAPRVHAELRSRGRKINRIVGRHLRRKKRTTIQDKTAPPVPDLVMRDFTADMLNTKWCGDITYVAVGSTWLYLATVIDICSRRVIGWSIADHMRTSLVTDAIEMAVAVRGGQVHGVVFHTDRGAQHGSAAFAEVCLRHGIRRRVWAASAQVATTPSPNHSSGASSASCCTEGAGPRRRRHGWSCSGGCRTTTGAAATPPSATSRQPNTNSN